MRDAIASRACALVLASGCALASALPASAQNTYPTAGNVGIGTTSPTNILTISQDQEMNSSLAGQFHLLGRTNPLRRLAIGYDTTANFAWFQAAESGAGYKNIGINPMGGNVGIGTSNPTDVVHLSGMGASVRIDSVGASKAGIKLSKNGVIRWDINSPMNSVDLSFINASGAPVLTLDQVGNFSVAGNLAAKYQDVAEWVKAPRALPPGTVVVIDAAETNRVLPAAKAFDQRVAGVVSAQPGLLLGEAGGDRVKVAHSGRVKVKVDARHGPVAVGDLLVTSPTPGYAMRSTPVDVGGVPIHRPGTLLGKALEPLGAGQGEILVLLMLQ